MSKTVLVTGSDGFIGRNLTVRLAARGDVEILTCTRETSESELAERLASADVVYHLAGVNRPETVKEFEIVNVGLTETLVAVVEELDRVPRIVFASSIQAELDNPYGRSKKEAERVLSGLADRRGVPVFIFRLTNVFGKWSRPDYNSVVATFCHNIANGLPITISDPARELELVYIDEVVEAFVQILENELPAVGSGSIVRGALPSHRITLGDLADRVRTFRRMQQTLVVPDFSLPFNRQLYATYLSYVTANRWEYPLERKADERGDLAEFIKSRWFGQIFVSRTRPGVTRGNHFHDTKTEKFLVLSGKGLVRFRHVERTETIEFEVRGEEYRVIDIPPGYTHSITNVGGEEMITLFWASEIFDPDRPDTTYLSVDGSPADADQ